jgi:ATP/maltotriose-dependent transcriptional regulator MalT
VMCLCNLGLIALAQTHYERASTALREGLYLARELDQKVIIQYSLYGLAAVATAQGEPARAARLWGAAEAMSEAYGVHLTPVTRSRTNYEGYLAAARSQLDEDTFRKAWAEGKAMKAEEAVEYALSEEEAASPTLSELEEPPPNEPLSMLTRREKDVGTLVAKDLSNRQIAAALTLSEHTVATHVRNVLKKLGLNSRNQIAAYFTEQR